MAALMRTGGQWRFIVAVHSAAHSVDGYARRLHLRERVVACYVHTPVRLPASLSPCSLRCEEVAKTNDPCPMAIGHHNQISSSAADFTGKLVTKITWKTGDGREILCA